MTTTLQKAVTKLILDAPFFGSLILRLPLIEDDSIPTACTDGTSIRYNPAFFADMTAGQVAFVLAHEVMHISNLHHLRRGGRDAKKWNIAGDHAINLLLKECGFDMLDCALADPAYAGLSAEQIYNKLPTDQDNGQGQGNGNGNGSEEGNDPGGCGGFEDPTDDKGNGLTEAEMQRQAAEWRVTVQQAAAAAKAQGKLPGAIARMVEEVVKPKLDWRDILHSFMQRVKQDAYTWSKPNRRFIGDDLYLPSRDGVELQPIIITIDTSGSLADDDLAQFQAEINAILDSFNAEVKVIYCDSQVHHVDTFTADQRPIKLQNIGGGGTDFRPPFQWVEKQNEPVTCMLYFTDLWCNRFPVAPEYPVLWVATEKGFNDPPFGEVAPLY